MRLIFRADATLDIGTGHVMRSLAIAEEAISRGIECIFVGNTKQFGWIENRLTDIGFCKIFQESEDFNSNKDTDVLVIDSYEIDPKHNFLNGDKWLKIVSIFDQLTPEYLCHLKIHPGIREYGFKLNNTLTVGGANHIPLRKSIHKVNKLKESIPLKILVVGGGVDKTNFVLSISQVLASIDREFNAVLLTNTLKPKFLDARFSVMSIGSGLHQVADDMDLIFSTASTTSLEFLARGFAVAIGCAVDNQRQYYSDLTSKEVVQPIGKFTDKWEFEIESIFEIVKSENIRNNFRIKNFKLIDLLGCKRILDLITGMIKVS